MIQIRNKLVRLIIRVQTLDPLLLKGMDNEKRRSGAHTIRMRHSSCYFKGWEKDVR